MAENFVLKGNICYSQDAQTLVTVEQGYLVCLEGRSAGVYRELPQEYAAFPLKDYGDRMIVPGLVDLHIHAPQYSFRGLGMDLELLEWLNTRTFPEEAKYRDAEYAKKAYSIFADNMKRSATTRACIFATLHREATEVLMDLMEESGLKTMIGKVNMDRNCPDFLIEDSAEASAKETVRWLEEISGRYRNTEPILTPEGDTGQVRSGHAVPSVGEPGRDCMGKGALSVGRILWGCIRPFRTVRQRREDHHGPLRMAA